MIHRGNDGIRVWLMACLTACLMALPIPAASAEDVNELIDGVISRATAIHSIQLTFTHRGYWLRDGQPVDDHTLGGQMAVEGTSWVLRYDGSANFRMRRHQAMVSYVEVDSAENSRIYRTLYVEAPQSIQDLINESQSNAVTRLGGFWYAAQVDFIDRNRQKAVVRGERLVDGITTIELEWPVEGTDFDEALIIVPDGIAQKRHGWLRISVAPQLGYALPRIEYATDDGEVEHEVTASEFVNEGGNVFFPRRGGVKTKGMADYHVHEFVVHDVTKLNVPLPPDTFSMAIPLGTRVSDSRPGVPQSVFDLENQEQLDQLNITLGDTGVLPTGRKRRLLLVLNSVCFLICLSIYVMQRCYRDS